jgi:hypothetical protein
MPRRRSLRRSFGKISNSDLQQLISKYCGHKDYISSENCKMARELLLEQYPETFSKPVLVELVKSEYPSKYQHPKPLHSPKHSRVKFKPGDNPRFKKLVEEYMRHKYITEWEKHMKELEELRTEKEKRDRKEKEKHMEDIKRWGTGFSFGTQLETVERISKLKREFEAYTNKHLEFLRNEFMRDKFKNDNEVQFYLKLLEQVLKSRGRKSPTAEDLV